MLVVGWSGVDGRLRMVGCGWSVADGRVRVVGWVRGRVFVVGCGRSGTGGRLVGCGWTGALAQGRRVTGEMLKANYTISSYSLRAQVPA